LDEKILTSRVVESQDEILKMARQDNAYVASWNDEQMLDRFVEKEPKPAARKIKP